MISTNQRAANAAFSTRLLMILVIAWALGASLARSMPALALLALPPAVLAALPVVRLGRWQHRILGPAPTPELVGLDPTQHLARVRERRRLEQLHDDRSWLLIGIVALVAVFDLYTGPDKGSSHLAFPVSLGIALLLQAFANQRIGWYTDRIAIDVAKSLPSRGPVIPPLRRASPAALTGIGIVALASIAALRG